MYIYMYVTTKDIINCMGVNFILLWVLLILGQGVKVRVSVSHVDFFLHVQWQGLADPLTKDNNINNY